jgi:hypothetical protein
VVQAPGVQPPPVPVRSLHLGGDGVIGSLSHLVRAAAQLAIIEGDEAITRKLL